MKERKGQRRKGAEKRRWGSVPGFLHLTGNDSLGWRFFEEDAVLCVAEGVRQPRFHSPDTGGCPQLRTKTVSRHYQTALEGKISSG